MNYRSIMCAARALPAGPFAVGGTCRGVWAVGTAAELAEGPGEGEGVARRGAWEREELPQSGIMYIISDVCICIHMNSYIGGMYIGDFCL